MYRTINPNKIPHNQDKPDFSHKNPSFLSKESADIDKWIVFNEMWGKVQAK